MNCVWEEYEWMISILTKMVPSSPELSRVLPSHCPDLLSYCWPVGAIVGPGPPRSDQGGRSRRSRGRSRRSRGKTKEIKGKIKEGQVVKMSCGNLLCQTGWLSNLRDDSPSTCTQHLPEHNLIFSKNKNLRSLSWLSDMRFVQKFSLPDFQARTFTPSISPYFNSFSGKKHKKWVKMEKFTPLAKILHCRRHWRHGQIPPLSTVIQPIVLYNLNLNFFHKKH